jgi:hypothetical protein
MAESPCYTEIDIASGEFNYSTGFWKYEKSRFFICEIIDLKWVEL